MAGIIHKGSDAHKLHLELLKPVEKPVEKPEETSELPKAKIPERKN